MPTKYPVLRNALNRRMVELQLMMFGVSSDEVKNLSDWEINRDLRLVQYLMEKQADARAD